jgi:hypothetical protein
MKRLITLKSFQIFKSEIKKSRTFSGWCSFLRPVQWYHSHVDPIWPDGTFNDLPGYVLQCDNTYLKDLMFSLAPAGPNEYF